MSRALVVAMVLACVAAAFSQPLEVGLTDGSAAVLAGSGVGVGARALGMGGAYTALAGDSTALYWNPAGLAHAGGMRGAFSVAGKTDDAEILNEVQDLWDAISEERLGPDVFSTLRGIARRTNGNPIAASIGAMAGGAGMGFGAGAFGEGHVDAMADYATDNDTETLDVAGMATWQYSAGLGYATELAPGRTAGIVVRKVWVGYEAAQFTATRVAGGPITRTDILDTNKRDDDALFVDVGFRARLPDNVIAGLTVKNLNGPDLTLVDDRGNGVLVDIEPTVNIGAAAQVEEFLVAADLHNLFGSNDADTMYHIGVETDVVPLLRVRAGLHDGDLAFGLSTRLGTVNLGLVADESLESMAALQIGFDF